MVNLDKIYTRGGDHGETSLAGGARVAKSHIRVETMGSVDEANAAVGLARLHTQGEHARESDRMLARIQNDLFDLGADLARPQETAKDAQPAKSALRIVQSQIDRLEAEIDTLNANLAPLTSFVLPGGTAASAYLHLARTIVRRAERLAVALRASDSTNPLIVTYLNRLSDHLFVLARALNDGGERDVLWIPGENR
jgi:cob(I)alamin adenosyltransferase